MSWVKSVASSEDVFDEDVDDISLLNKEWKCNMEKRAKDGFRDGTDAGKEASLQVGFNMGYSEGATKMRAIGQLKGIMSAVRCWCHSQLPGSPAWASVTDLLQKVEKHEEGLVEAMRKAQEKPPPNVTEMVDDMEDLNVEQRNHSGDSGSCTKDGDCCGNDGEIACCGMEEDSRIVSQKSSSLADSFEQLLKCCLDLVTELGLPEELKCHIQQIIDR
ncbi:OTU deubiquitinase with linear linkage specificity a [Triplophysa rosa]|uniref:Yae1 domain-containing protein 1 n=1 Tax=Triplophysa rosa TaxID=992332 RepID=A0A9W7W9Q4_TRIRA|nr:OTU deubiquitinase with linear linkage specificity a [Triplophysa rosa]KAI7792331.1 yae1 domain-containing protein 1 [Triplophysa rosa]